VMPVALGAVRRPLYRDGLVEVFNEMRIVHGGSERTIHTLTPLCLDPFRGTSSSFHPLFIYRTVLFGFYVFVDYCCSRTAALGEGVRGYHTQWDLQHREREEGVFWKKGGLEAGLVC